MSAAGIPVLVVEDDATNARLLNDILAPAGYEVRHARDWTETNDFLRTFTPNVVLLDIGLPEIDGFEILKRLRSMPSMEGVPIVAVTAHLTPENEQRIATEFDGLVRKPIDVQTLYETLRRLLDPDAT